MIFFELVFQRAPSAPNALLRKAKEKLEEYKENDLEGFNSETDYIVIVCDVDWFRSQENINEFLQENENTCILFAFTYPSFELFLYLHDRDKYEERMGLNRGEIERNDKIGKKDRAIYHYFKKDFGFDCKTHNNASKIEELSEKVKHAMKNEELVNVKYEEMYMKISSNVGKLLGEYLFENVYI